MHSSHYSRRRISRSTHDNAFSPDDEDPDRVVYLEENDDVVQLGISHSHDLMKPLEKSSGDKPLPSPQHEEIYHIPRARPHNVISSQLRTVDCGAFGEDFSSLIEITAIEDEMTSFAPKSRRISLDAATAAANTLTTSKFYLPDNIQPEMALAPAFQVPSNHKVHCNSLDQPNSLQYVPNEKEIQSRQSFPPTRTMTVDFDRPERWGKRSSTRAATQSQRAAENFAKKKRASLGGFDSSKVPSLASRLQSTANSSPSTDRGNRISFQPSFLRPPPPASRSSSSSSSSRHPIDEVQDILDSSSSTSIAPPFALNIRVATDNGYQQAPGGYSSPSRGPQSYAPHSSPMSTGKRKHKTFPKGSIASRLAQVFHKIDKDEARVLNIRSCDIGPRDLSDPRRDVSLYVDVVVVSEGKSLPPYLTCVLRVNCVSACPSITADSTTPSLVDNRYINALFLEKSCRDYSRRLTRGNTLRIYDPMFLPDVHFPPDEQLEDMATGPKEEGNKWYPTLVCTQLLEHIDKGTD